MQLEKTITNNLPKKKTYKLWGIICLVSLYPLYYFLSNLPEELSFQSVMIDQFESRGLLLLFFIVSLSLFLYHYSRRKHIYQMEFYYQLFQRGDDLVENKRTRKNIQSPKGLKNLTEKSDSSVIALEVSEIIDIDKRRRTGTSTTENIGLTVSGSNTIGDKLGTPLSLTKTTSNYDYIQTFFVYKNGKTQAFSTQFSNEEIKGLLNI